MKGRRTVSTSVTVCMAALLLGACAQTNLAIYTVKRLGKEARGAAEDASPAVSQPSARPGTKIGKPYQVAGVWYYPREDPGYDETGIASWYGQEFHGRPTANGEIYDMNALSAAHKTLPMPSEVRVTNLENGRSLVLRVNDRGPFAHGRIIDVSRRAAQLLGFERVGTARVRVAAVGAGDERFVPKPITPDSERLAVAAAPLTEISAEPLPAPPGVAEAPPRSTPTAPTARRSDSNGASAQIVDLPTVPGQVTTVSVGPTSLYVQAGAFSFIDNARRLRRALQGFGPTQISVARLDGRDYYRVRIGPLRDLSSADIMLAQVIESGYPGARIVVD